MLCSFHSLSHPFSIPIPLFPLPYPTPLSFGRYRVEAVNGYYSIFTYLNFVRNNRYLSASTEINFRHCRSMFGVVWLHSVSRFKLPDSKLVRLDYIRYLWLPYYLGCERRVQFIMRSCQTYSIPAPAKMKSAVLKTPVPHRWTRCESLKRRTTKPLLFR